MSEEEKEAVKLVLEQYKKWIDNPTIMIVPEQCKMVTSLGITLNLVEKQKIEERNLKKELMEQDELIEKLSKELHNKNKRKIYIRRKKQ